MSKKRSALSYGKNYFELLDEDNFNEDDCLTALKHIKSLIPQVVFIPFKPRFVISQLSTLSYFSENGKACIVDKKDTHFQNLEVKITCVCISRDGVYTFCGDKDGRIHKILSISLQKLNTFAIHDGKVRFIKSNGEKLYSADNKLVKISKENDFETIGEFDRPVIDLCKDGVFIADRAGLLKIPNKIEKKTDFIFTAVKTSEENVILGCSTGEVLLFDYESLELIYKTVPHKGKVTCIDLDDKGMIITGSKDSTISVWNIKNPYNISHLSGHSSKITSVKHIPNSIIACSSLGFPYKWRRPSLVHCEILTQRTKISKVLLTSSYIILLCEFEVLLIKTSSYSETVSFEYSDIIDIAADFNKLGIFCANSIVVVDLLDLKTTAFEVKNATGISIISEHFVVLYTNKIDFCNPKNPDFLAFTREVTNGKAVASDSNQKIFVLADRIFVISEGQDDNEDTELENSFYVDYIYVKSPCVVGLGSDVKIWNIETGLHMRTLDVANAKNVWIDSNYLYLADEATLQVWDLKIYSKILKLPMVSSSCSSLGMDICYSNNKDLIIFENPLKTNEIAIYGPNKYELSTEIYDVISNINKPISKDIQGYIISPFLLNPLHLFAYINLYSQIEELVRIGVPLIDSKKGENPLTISISKNFSQSVDALLKSLSKMTKTNHHVLYYIYKQFTILNYSYYAEIDSLYNCLLYRNKSQILPKFVSPAFSLPHISCSESIHPEVLPYCTNGQEVKYYDCLILLPTVAGSRDSLDYTRSLAMTPNKSIFNSSFIQNLLQYKWQQVKFYLLFQGGFYFFYIIMLSIYTIYFMNTTSYLLIVFVINLVFILNEVVQILFAGIMYWADWWNYIDLARSLMVVIYSGIVVSDSFEDDSRVSLLVIITMLSWLRGINYFRLFDNTRYMVNMIKEVVKDALSFLLLFLYSTLAFGFIYFALDDADSDEIATYLRNSYKFNLSDYDTETYDTLEWIVFLAASMINIIIMLNLLIAIFSDTYTRVKENRIIADQLELAQLIYEGEVGWFIAREQNKYNYLHVFTNQETFVESDQVLSQVKSLKKKINTMQKSVYEIAADNKSTNQKVEGLYEKIDNMHRTIEKIEKKIVK